MTEQIDPRTEFLKHAMSRRGFMSAVGATGAAAALAACGTSSEDSSSEASGTGEQTSGENVVWANWHHTAQKPIAGEIPWLTQL